MPKILVVEDSKFQIAQFRTAFEEKGFEVLVAEDALQGGIAARRQAPDAVLLDINMPGGSGIEVLKRLKNSEMTRKIPVIVVSGNEKPEARNEALKLGAIDFLAKPVDIEKLTKMMADLFSTSRHGISR